MSNKTKQLGQYYTLYNPFIYNVFKEWLRNVNLTSDDVILEPFAGAGNLVSMINNLGFSNEWDCFDIEPGASFVKYRDTIANFPAGYKLCITNPPYLAKNSASRLGLDYPNTNYDDLYKLCINKCLENCDYVAAIIPESFINSKELKERLSKVISLTKPMFEYTDCPVCLALFNKKETKDFEVYKEDTFLSLYNSISINYIDLNYKFNDPKGDLGLYAVDNTAGRSIRFCRGEEIDSKSIKISSRSYTRISLPVLEYIDLDLFISKLNFKIEEFRNNTNDIYLTSFKGLRKDGFYRRRMDWKVAKYIITKTINNEEII